VREPSDFKLVDWSQLPHPVAVEYIDTRSADGLYRKYRYLVTGSTGIRRHAIIARSWCVHAEDRLREQKYRDEEMAFLQDAEPYHKQLMAGAAALGLDYVAFDYSFDLEGRLVVREPNPFADLWAWFNAWDSYFDYQRLHVDSVFEHILSYYLQRANLLPA
jgi:hypothetical protein